MHFQRIELDMNAPPLLITSLKNDQIKDLVRLRKRRDRDRSAVTIIEESMVIQQAFNAHYPWHTLYFCPEQVAPDDQHLLDNLLACCSSSEYDGPTAVQLAPQVMDRVSYREKGAGMLLVAPQITTHLESLAGNDKPKHPALFVVLEGVEKPGNLGAALRVADGAGADAVIICGEGTDLFNPNVLRASRGSFFAVPSITAESEEVVEFLHQQGVQLVATSPIADHHWDEVDLTGPVAMVLGTEHEGLSTELMSRCDLTVGIPMRGTGDSLNVSTSAAILLYEAVRQRRVLLKGKP